MSNFASLKNIKMLAGLMGKAIRNGGTVNGLDSAGADLSVSFTNGYNITDLMATGSTLSEFAEKMLGGNWASSTQKTLDSGIVVNDANIKSVTASKVSGTLATSNIPQLNANKITSGTFAADRIPELSATKITSGVLPLSVIPAGALDQVITVTEISSETGCDTVDISAYVGSKTDLKAQVGDILYFPTSSVVKNLKIADNQIITVDLSKYGQMYAYVENVSTTAALVPYAAGTAVNAKNADYATSAGSATSATSATTASTASKVANALTLQIGGATKSTFNGGAAVTFNVTKSDLGLGNVNNTADSSKSVASAAKWTTARSISIASSDGTGVSTGVNVDGSAAATLKLPATIKATLTGTATNVSNNLVIKLNGGTTEGTNMFTFNGSAAKTVNITASNLGIGVEAIADGSITAMFS